VIAASETRRLADSMGRSMRAARMPGAGNLTLAAIYVFLSFVVLAVVPWPGSQLGVNPTVAAWVVVLVANLLHIAVQAAVAFRYLSVAGEVPEAGPKRRSAPPARSRR
jgi:amino acid transporter